MPKLVPGTMLVKHELKETGNNKHTIESKEDTISLGPMTVSEVHAQVGSDYRVTLTENYHSATVGVSISIPVEANPTSVKNGLDWCAEQATLFLGKELANARRALREIAGSR